MQRLRRTPEFKEQALSKARQRGSRTLQEVAAELNVPAHTLKGWLKESRKDAGCCALLIVYNWIEGRPGG